MTEVYSRNPVSHEDRDRLYPLPILISNSDRLYPLGQETGFLAICWLDDRGLLKKPGFSRRSRSPHPLPMSEKKRSPDRGGQQIMTGNG